MTPGDVVTVAGYRGVAFTFRGRPLITPPCACDNGCDCDPGESYPDDERAIVVMIGDDHEHTVDIDDVKPHAGPVCSCGQLGCGWHGESDS